MKSFTDAMLVQKHQLDTSEAKVAELDNALDSLLQSQATSMNDLEEMLETVDSLLELEGKNTEPYLSSIDISDLEIEIENTLREEGVEYKATRQLDLIKAVDFNDSMSWEEYSTSAQAYAELNQIDLLKDPFDSLLTTSQKVDIEKRIKQEFVYKNANCDKYDYMIAGTCGVIGGLIDVFLVGAPGEGKLTEVADNSVDSAVEKFASSMGWKGPKEGSDSTSSAIGFLERKFKVNYDHRHGADVDGAFSMSTKNHHIKSLGHSPDLVGLIFSILDQFNNTATFIDGGKLITINTENFELQGGNFIAKVYCGFCNWLGHLFSDVAGSSGASGRGSGIPIPFFSLLQFLDFGEFGQHKQSFAKVSVQVFENGYDFRHGLALAIPVLITEILTRMMWVVKQKFYHDKPWNECIPSGNNPELRRMLLVAHGSLCLIDAGDAALRSGGDMINFLLRTNIIGWARFGTLAYKEVNAWYKSGKIDPELVDDYIDKELERMLSK